MRPGLKRSADRRGFTLIETIVALAIMGIGIVLVLQLFSGGLRSSKTSHAYTTAMIHAREKMEEMLVKQEQGSGDFGDGFSWQTDITTFNAPEYEGATIKQIAVTVKWDTSKSVEVVTLKTVQEEDI